jgi:hypothetical protein
MKPHEVDEVHGINCRNTLPGVKLLVIYWQGKIGLSRKISGVK